MKKYNEFLQVYIGESDIGSVTVRVPSKVFILNFGGDGRYNAYECFGDVEIGAHYEKVFSGEHWLKIYDDFGRSYDKSKNDTGYELFDIYTAGSRGCIIHWHN